MNEEATNFLGEMAKHVDQYRAVRYITRASEFHDDTIGALQRSAAEASELKCDAVVKADEDSANAFLSLEEALVCFINELKMWIALKKDEPNEAWGYLVYAETSAQTSLQAHPVGEMFKVDFERLDLLEHLLFPPQIFFSLGFVAKRSSCSICGGEYGECGHLVGRAYMGEICVRIIAEITQINEVSVVPNPANKQARMTSMTREGIVRDVMTWRALPNEPQDPPADGAEKAPTG